MSSVVAALIVALVAWTAAFAFAVLAHRQVIVHRRARERWAADLAAEFERGKEAARREDADLRNFAQRIARCSRERGIQPRCMMCPSEGPECIYRVVDSQLADASARDGVTYLARRGHGR